MAVGCLRPFGHAALLLALSLRELVTLHTTAVTARVRPCSVYVGGSAKHGRGICGAVNVSQWSHGHGHETGGAGGDGQGDHPWWAFLLGEPALVGAPLVACVSRSLSLATRTGGPDSERRAFASLAGARCCTVTCF